MPCHRNVMGVASIARVTTAGHAARGASRTWIPDEAHGVATPAARSRSRSADGTDAARAGPPRRPSRPPAVASPSASASCEAASPTTCTSVRQPATSLLTMDLADADRDPDAIRALLRMGGGDAQPHRQPVRGPTASSSALLWPRIGREAWWEPTRELIERGAGAGGQRARSGRQPVRVLDRGDAGDNAPRSAYEDMLLGPWLAHAARARARRQRDPVARLDRLHGRSHLRHPGHDQHGLGAALGPGQPALRATCRSIPNHRDGDALHRGARWPCTSRSSTCDVGDDRIGNAT